MALWQRLPADRELRRLFLGTEPDCISQPPLQLGVALWPHLSQWSREQRSGPLPGLAHKTFHARLSVPFPSLLANAEGPGDPGGLLPREGGRECPCLSCCLEEDLLVVGHTCLGLCTGKK